MINIRPVYSSEKHAFIYVIQNQRERVICREVMQYNKFYIVGKYDEIIASLQSVDFFVKKIKVAL